jgi:VanZ family protein
MLPRSLRLIGPVVLFRGLIFLVSAQNSLPPLPTAGFDKLLHMAEYAVLGALIARALQGYGQGVAAAIVSTAVLGALLGASDELHQSTVPGRVADPLDLLADLIGSTLGALGWFGLTRLRVKEPGR